MTRILIAGRGARLAELAETLGATQGWNARLVTTGRGMLSAAKHWDPHVIILGPSVTDGPGTRVCLTLRKACGASIVMLTLPGKNRTCIHVLEACADDCVPIDTSPREIIARIRAILRPRWEYRSSPSRLTCGNLELDGTTRQVYLEGRPIHLTRKEFELLREFMVNPGKTLSREHLYEAVWGDATRVQSRTLDMHIRSLRASLHRGAKAPTRLRTIRGQGYRFEG